jgi:Ca2+-transporting ATPase
VFVVIGISIYQTHKTERALEALRDLASPRALVIRDGKERRIAGREVVRGDLVVLSEGDRVPADGVVLWSLNLVCDESLLTGESLPVGKSEGTESAAMARPGGDDAPFVYSGTVVVAGQGAMRVKAIGLEAELGRIGRALEVAAPESSPLEREVARFVRILGVTGLALCTAIVVLYGLTRQSWLGGLLAGLALAMAMLPEEFPVIMTVFLAVGGWRMSRRNVLTRRMRAIEALGSVTVACVDKTGTLTENRMSVSVLAVDGLRFEVAAQSADPLPEDFHALVEFAILASQRDPFDPMEQAISRLGTTCLAGTEHLHQSWTLLREYPLSPSLLAMSHVWQSSDGAAFVIAAKGAPEAVADLCHLDAERTRRLGDEVAALADRGYRVLAVAGARLDRPPLPPGQHDFEFELLGLIALADPIREGVPDAVRECSRAGIRTVMITGDYPGTARRIAAQIGLTVSGEVVTGAELDAMDDERLQQCVRGASVFARVVPEQKLRLVRAFEANGEVVAMTGDGVNDAPALRAANIGIAMGARGTDVAREAADLVVLDDDFSSIVAAIRLGRRVMDNIHKGIAYVLAIHVPIAGLSLIPILLRWPLILLPVHIVFLELIIDPACSIVFEAEPEEGDVMDRPPRDPRAPLVDRVAIRVSLLQGATALLLVLGVLAVALATDHGEETARTLAFSSLVLTNLGLILTNRSSSRTTLRMLRVRNRALWWVIGGALGVLAACLTIAPLRGVFRFASPTLHDIGLVALCGVVAVIAFDLLKATATRRAPR